MGSAGSLFPSLSGTKSGTGERPHAHGRLGGARIPLESLPRGSATAVAAHRAPGERVSEGCRVWGALREEERVCCESEKRSQIMERIIIKKVLR